MDTSVPPDRHPTFADWRSPDSITRVDRSKRDAIAWYDRISPWYDALVGRFDRRPRNRGIALLNAEPGERALEVGFGTGRALVSFADGVGSDGHVVGLDSSSGMSAVARERVAAADVTDRVSIVQGDAERLPFDGDAFDAVFASFTLELFDTPSLPRVLGEWRRVLRDDGRLGVVALSTRDGGLVTRAYERLHEAFPRYADCRPIFVRELLEENEFDAVEAETRPLWGLTVEIVVATPR
ncbi:class I SAM-dependent methyltransferase [Natrinema salaciae]|uniref:Demethylmenaquinone methyltransferase / 2-methoxy-6-polyprenyl-1,4-benzoquinol methylase n=1 Tax=Natrinema salaciae TaxID=1186196 RepID=A0A1H9SPA1_9EURY|nr:methyltransferase domain-containing protein [Natrinema salaciae]SER86595.1 demethylmenaquinone methyltransferase / 2-methoxy-6-polyprenyl-1,4-benzoquinol methylase [Natrinema salaciae]